MAPDSKPSPDQLLEDLRMFGIRLGLDSCRETLKALGSPHLTIPIVLVAGTNGKGSTAALLASIATVAGYRTGLYTSPHLETVEERIRVNGGAISSADLVHCLERGLAAAAAVTDNPSTYFEALTIAALLHFADANVDLAILEVGLGGRLDATNVCEPVLSVITEIALDHQGHLGETFGEIALEKAGILRPGVPAVTWISEESAFSAVQRRADELGSALVDAREGTRISAPVGMSPRTKGSAVHPFQVTTAESSYSLNIALPGEHQRRNAALALRAAEILRRGDWNRLTPDAMAAGIRRCVWPGRLETVVLPDGRRVLLEAAHNPNGAQQLGSFLKSLHGEGKREDSGPVDVLFGVVKDKDGAALMEALGDLPRRWFLTAPPGERGRDPHTLPTLATGSSTIEADPGLALSLALEALEEPDCETPDDGTPDRGILLVYGSLFLVGFVRERLRQLFGVPTAAAVVSTVSPQ